MDVHVSGDGPAVDAVAAALADTDAVAAVEQTGPGAIADADLGVVVAKVGAAAFDTANETALAHGTPWLAVELGGVGDHSLPAVDAAVTGLGPDAGCMDCLRHRVDANADAEATPGDGSAAAENDGDGDADGAVTPATARLAGAYAGNAAVALAEEDHSPLGRVVELPHAERRFLPVPHCACAHGEHDWTVGRDADDAPLDEAVARAERTLDDRVGVVAEVGEVHSFPAPYYLARNGDTSGFSDGQAAAQAAGVADDWNAAFMKAVGEALERYAAGVYRTETFQTATLAALGDAGDAPGSSGPDVVRPDDFVRPDDAPAVDPEDPIDWVPGATLTTGDPALLPAEVVQFPPPQEQYVSAITTGLGLGTSSVGALLAGLYEVVERDATMLAWYSTFEPLGLAVDDDAFRTLEKRARSEGLSVTPLLVTQDVDVPVVAVAVHRDDGDWPQFAVGSDADLDPTAAATSALAEALQNWMELRGMGPSGAADEAGAIGRYGEFPRAAREFVDVPSTVPAASVGPQVPPTGADELDAVVSRLADADLTSYAARITPRDLDRAGFEAVRVVAPGAQPLFTDRAVFGERAASVPASLGFEPQLDRDHHPYP
jgi:ribosomal protein S12 methylthiotransferase accessory factor